MGHGRRILALLPGWLAAAGATAGEAPPEPPGPGAELLEFLGGWAGEDEAGDWVEFLAAAGRGGGKPGAAARPADENVRAEDDDGNDADHR